MGLDNPIHLALLLLIMLLVFGAKRLPEMGRSLGDGLRGFKEAVNNDGSTVHAESAADTVRASSAAHGTDALAPAPAVTPAVVVPAADAEPLARAAADSTHAAA